MGKRLFLISLLGCLIMTNSFAQNHLPALPVTITDRNPVLEDFDEDEVEPWETGSLGCSWYCGAELETITATAHLAHQAQNTYVADNLHDFDLRTAWAVEGKKAIGQKLNFTFKHHRPRVTTLYIWNGYFKTEKLWKANARVAKFKLYIDDQPIGIISLENKMKLQVVEFDPIVGKDAEAPMKLTLEIMEVYSGTTYQDVCVSEINFDGLDVHCLGAGTRIAMADGSEKNIEEIKTGDRVMTYNITRKKTEPTTVTHLVEARHKYEYVLTFEDEITITSSDAHPFYTDQRVWASLNEYKSNTAYVQKQPIEELAKGMKVFKPLENKYVRFNSYEKFKGQKSYTLMLKKGDNFIANGLMVKTEIAK